ncbi:MAG: SHOCT domain-containing protein [Acidimicrobiia bacterium]|nr:SHOCT domain-containing protein [Acidimicrobiia bacterium]
MFWLFMFMIWFWLLIVVFGDIFRDHELSGGAKAAWSIFVIILPYLGIFVYLIARGHGMAARSQSAQAEQKAAFDSYVRETAGSANPADQIAKAKGLLDSGAITQEEFDTIKRNALN